MFPVSFFYFCPMDATEKVVLLLGSNIEPRKKFLEKAAFLLEQELGSALAGSSVYESEPWGFKASVNFLNRVLIFETDKSPELVLDICLDVEMNLGRERNNEAGYSSRTVDVDILYVGNRIINTSRLTVPHPRLQQRRFALLPLMELLPEMVHPVLEKSHKKLLIDCSDLSEVTIIKEH